jgi:hypothetical protein
MIPLFGVSLYTAIPLSLAFIFKETIKYMKKSVDNKLTEILVNEREKMYLNDQPVNEFYVSNY